jgi:hypothetical protein
MQITANGRTGSRPRWIVWTVAIAVTVVFVLEIIGMTAPGSRTKGILPLIRPMPAPILCIGADTTGVCS